jgi:hypothetical protein
MNKTASKQLRCKATQPKRVGTGRERCPMPAHGAQFHYTEQFCSGHQWSRYGSIAKVVR